MSPEELREQLWKLSPDERVAMLIFSCVESDPGALGAVLNIVTTVSAMGQRLSPHHRNVLVGNLRLAAHRLERVARPVEQVEVVSCAGFLSL
ncbi:MAG: hypothetical protein WCB22_31265 [Pseudolabrys sp.]|jgi:hypothetical protein